MIYRLVPVLHELVHGKVLNQRTLPVAGVGCDGVRMQQPLLHV